VAPGRRIDRIAAHIDLLPTLLEACGVEKPAGLALDGRSLMPLVRGDKVEWTDRTLYTQWHRGDEPEPFRACAVRTQRFKLVDGQELYDLIADPGETRDIAAANPQTVAAMRKDYERWFADVSATRGYAPPRIHLGTQFENPVTLTRQDWRGPRAGWSEDSLGYWEVHVAEGGRYEIIVRTFPVPDAGEVSFQLNSAPLRQAVANGSTECRFAAVELRSGPGRLHASLQYGEKVVGARYVEVRRLW